MRKHVFFFDVLRCVAAVAVIAIHVFGPYRHEFGNMPLFQWSAAITLNSFSRWAVPVFILITGALMLSDQRPFDAGYYIKKRLGKVLLPFVVWSLFYCYLSGWSDAGYSTEVSLEVLKQSPNEATYYHLGFFYYFIPLYFVIPFLQVLVKKVDNAALYALLLVWLITTTLFLFRVDGIWSHNIWLYSGYLLLGYILYQKLTLNTVNMGFIVVAGVVGLGSTALMVIQGSIEAGEYTFGRWLSYKTLNTVAAASMIFMLGRYYGEGLSDKVRQVVGFISKHSLGIYILHPIFLWPMINFRWYEGTNPLWFIPLWVVLSGSAALLTSWLFSLSPKSRWLLP
ncbi:acyltransferase [Vibrio hannami]|uniref:acyltransferase n=1 Tax=Vibrio hannami TaxID=2717094 RepID=UPI00240F29D9|nr:acyltransferase [Vibrio hannami]MDG3086671.1 acyltransferase [Vibrio hannami]